MRAQRIGGIAELLAALILGIAAIWQWHTGVYRARTPVQLPDDAAQWLTIYDGPHIISAFALVAAAVLLLVDGAVRIHRARSPQPRSSRNRTASPGRN